MKTVLESEEERVKVEKKRDKRDEGGEAPPDSDDFEEIKISETRYLLTPFIDSEIQRIPALKIKTDGEWKSSKLFKLSLGVVNKGTWDKFIELHTIVDTENKHD